jgi:hypothetical protein
LLLLLATLLPLAAAELFFRVRYQRTLDLGDEELWDSSIGTPARNRFGYREQELTPEILGNDYRRILFLGDSFTYGWGVTRGEDRFSDRIEARLNEQSDGSRYLIYNAATPASDPSHWVKEVPKLLPGLRPQVVFAIFFLRDGTSLSTSLQHHKKAIRALRQKYTDNLAYRRSYLARTLLDQRVFRDFTRSYLEQFKLAYLGNDEQTRPWVTAQNNLLEIRRHCRDNDLDFHLIIFPLLFGLDDYAFEDVEAEIARFATENDIPVFSLLEGFRGQRAENLWVSRQDQHPNEEGHRIAAETLLPYVRKVLSDSRR